MPSASVCGDCKTLWGEPIESSPPPAIASIPSEEIIDLYEVMGSAVMVTWLFWHTTMEEIFVNIQFCGERIVALGLDPMADDHLAMTLQEGSGLAD